MKALLTGRMVVLLFLALWGACELYGGVSLLFRSFCFVAQSYGVTAHVVDLRRREEGDWFRLLDSGEWVYKGCVIHYPVVSYPAKGENYPLLVELSQERHEPYQLGESLFVRVDERDSRLVKECHGFFLWGGGLQRLGGGSLLLWLAYALLKWGRRLKSAPQTAVVAQAAVKESEKPEAVKKPAKRGRKKKDDSVPTTPKSRPVSKEKSPRKPKQKSKPKSTT